jgi:Alpha/beta hydrolase
LSELLGADTDVMDRLAESLSTDTRRVQDIRTLARRAVAELQASWGGPDLLQLTQQWEQQASPQLAGALASLDTCAARLRAQSTAQKGASSGDGAGSGRFAGGLAAVGALGSLIPGLGCDSPMSPAGRPPNNGSPGGSAAWWRSLSPNQQQQVIREHPEWIGNRDGIPSTTRDQANRALLSVHRAQLLATRSRLEADLADNWSGGLFTTDDAALDQVNDKVASLDAVEEVLARTGDRQLLVLDVGPERAEAAIARGNVDTADNVAVFVPGLDTTVDDDLGNYDHRMDELQRRTELESRRAGAHESAATVTWIGYQTPQTDLDVITPGRSVATDNLAHEGANKLAPFLRGIGAARESDPHLTLLAHSYGSTTAGLALQQGTGVDDAVFFGSPGLGTNHVEDLNLADGHAYYVEAQWDPVGDLGGLGLGDLGWLGIDPSHMDGIEHASARESTVVDPMTGEVRHFKEVTGHSSYLDDDSTSQYNMSVVVAGVPDRRVYDQGEGVGDVLSWPVPGTF